MKIIIQSTDKLTTMDGVPVRVWNGVTERGVRCFVFVHRLAVAADQDTAAFEAELKEQKEPIEITHARAIDLRHIL